MAGVLTVMKTLNGSAVSDALDGGDTGYDFGESENGQTPPEHEVFLKHDGTQEISSLAVNVQAYSGTYGGDYSAAADLTKLVAHGDADHGLQADFRWDAATTFETGQFTQFETGAGVSYATRITIPATAMSRNNAGTEVDASAPVAGTVGPATDSVLGDRAHMTFRYKNPSSEVQSGTRQFDIYFSFNFTT